MPKSDIVEGSVACVVVRTSCFTPFCGAPEKHTCVHCLRQIFPGSIQGRHTIRADSDIHDCVSFGDAAAETILEPCWVPVPRSL
jgi:hypothetical protein